MKNKERLVIGLHVAFVLSASLFSYPSFASFWNERNKVQEARMYENSIIHEEDPLLSKSLEDAKTYNEALFQNRCREDYEKQLCISDMMGFIEIEKIDLKIAIYHDTDEDTLQKGIGHLKESSLPIGGKNTHAVLTGHTGLVGKRMFTDLDCLSLGDTFRIHVLKETLSYVIDEIRIVLPNEIEGLEIKEGKDYVSLVTCTPYGINDHRLIIRGKRVFCEEEKKETIHLKPKRNSFRWLFCIIGSAFFLGTQTHQKRKSKISSNK